MVRTFLHTCIISLSRTRQVQNPTQNGVRKDLRAISTTITIEAESMYGFKTTKTLFWLAKMDYYNQTQLVVIYMSSLPHIQLGDLNSPGSSNLEDGLLSKILRESRNSEQGSSQCGALVRPRMEDNSKKREEGFKAFSDITFPELDKRKYRLCGPHSLLALNCAYPEVTKVPNSSYLALNQGLSSSRSCEDCLHLHAAALHFIHLKHPNSSTFSIVSSMEYLELDESAMQALKELDGDFSSQHVSPKWSISTFTSSETRPRRRVEVTYLLRLEDPFPTPRDVSNALGLSRVPQLETGTTEDGEASFCRLSQSSINAFDSWVTKHHPDHKFTKIRISLTHRDPSKLPTLGRDATLPHHRPQSQVSSNKHVSEYPVHYFFYGILVDPGRLGRLFGVPASELPPLRPAILLHGRIRTWASKYPALVDFPGSTVSGFVYVVISTEQADALRAYEGDNYEVVAAKLIVDGDEKMGRTFRFSGSEDELTG